MQHEETDQYQSVYNTLLHGYDFKKRDSSLGFKNYAMRTMGFSFFALVLLLISCDHYGKRIKINDNLEVYTKGDSVTDADAKKLGVYFASLSADNTNDKSLQLSKDSGWYVVRMVVDEKKLGQDSTLDVSFVALKTLMETEVFKGQPTRLVLTDSHFNDLKSYQTFH